MAPAVHSTLYAGSNTPTESLRVARERMIRRDLRGRGIRDPRVLQAMLRVPRHAFVAPELVSRAYDDVPLPTLDGQTISQPYIVARMSEALGLIGGERVLEIGTGSGYQAAVLAELGAQVVSIECSQRLHEDAAQRLAELGYAVRLIVGDGTLGWPAAAPYDGILATGSLPRIPQALVVQLAPRGRLVAPVGSLVEQALLVVDSTPSRFRRQTLCVCRFVPLVGAAGWRPDGTADKETHATD